MKIPARPTKSSYGWASTDDIVRWYHERTTSRGLVRFRPDPETAGFGGIVFAVVAVIALIAWPLSMLIGWGVWIVAGVVGLIPVLFAVAFAIALISGYFDNIKDVRNLKKEISRR